jgi:hypothetical protein
MFTLVNCVFYNYQEILIFKYLKFNFKDILHHLILNLKLKLVINKFKMGCGESTEKVGEPIHTTSGKGSKKRSKQASRVGDVVHNVFFPFFIC